MIERRSEPNDKTHDTFSFGFDISFSVARFWSIGHYAMAEECYRAVSKAQHTECCYSDDHRWWSMTAQNVNCLLPLSLPSLSRSLSALFFLDCSTFKIRMSIKTQPRSGNMYEFQFILYFQITFVFCIPFTSCCQWFYCDDIRNYFWLVYLYEVHLVISIFIQNTHMDKIHAKVINNQLIIQITIDGKVE